MYNPSHVTLKYAVECHKYAVESRQYAVETHLKTTQGAMHFQGNPN